MCRLRCKESHICSTSSRHVGSLVHTPRVVSGGCRSGKRPPPHTCPFEEADVENYRRRIPTIHHLHPRSPTCVCLRKTPHPPGTSPWPARSSPPRPEGFRSIPKPLRSVPGITRDSRMSACPPPDAPRRGHHVGYRILWAEGWWFEVTVVPGVTVGEPGPRT